jgi:membrane protease YdiL (CAAX protease family)
MIAVFEEVIFRGFLLSVCLRLAIGPAVLATLGLVAAFALSHIWFGWIQVAAKTPLAVVTTATVLLTGGIVAAIAIHVLFNVRVAARARSGPPVRHARR